MSDKREVLLSGWTLNINANSLIDPSMGPDGWLYLTSAIRGFDVTTQEGERMKGGTARIWRVRPDGSGLEWVSAGGMNNPVELTFTNAGEVLGMLTYFVLPQRGLRDALNFWVEGGVYGRPNRNIIRDKLTLTGELMPVVTKYSRVSPSGIGTYRNDILGKDFKNNLFSAQFNTQSVIRHQLFRDGASFRTENEVFFSSNNEDFHPTDVLEDADGSLLVVETGGWFIKGCPIKDNNMKRRQFIEKASLSAATLAPVLAMAGKGMGMDSSTLPNNESMDILPPPKFTLAVHMNANFTRQAASMPIKERFDLAAGEGAKAYQIGAFSSLDLEEYRRHTDRHGMRCASLAGTGKVGLTTGLTAPGQEKVYLNFFTKAVEAAKTLGAQNLVSFVGERVETIPWETQYEQIISGLKKAGDIAEEAGVYFTLEPLNPFWRPKMTVMTAKEGFQIIRDVDHPNVKLDFDIYHLQQSEGNLTINLRKGIGEGLIQYVEVGDVPGRFEPGTGEINFQHIFNELRRLGYNGFIGMEHFTKTDFKSAFNQVKRLAGVA